MLTVAKAYPDEIDRTLQLAGALQPTTSVGRIIIHLDQRTPTVAFRRFGRRTVPVFNYFQAGLVLYASLFEPEVARLDLWHLPAPHRQGPTLLNVARTLDLPQALALAQPRPIRLYVRDEAEARNWRWALELQKALGAETLKIRTVGD